MSRPLRLGTRGSQLALWQAQAVARRLEENGFGTEIVTISTTGDRRTDVPLASIGGKGLFIKELEDALQRGEIDLAVHSLKDIPSLTSPEYFVSSALERGDPRDAWVNIDHRAPEDLPVGSTVGTSAPRRRAQLAALFPNIRVEEMRGNVDTRIAKVQAGLYDGAVLAAAGLTRLGREPEITSCFPPDVMTPAAGQGIVALQALASRSDVLEACLSIQHPPTELAARCERGLLQKFGQVLDCYSAVGVHATIDGDIIGLNCFFSDLEGRKQIRHQEAGSSGEIEDLLNRAARALRAAGALEVVQGKGTR